MSNKLRWGVLSTASIGRTKVIPAMQQGQYTSVVAIASRDLAKAQQAATALGIPTAYGSYEELLTDPNIDAIYNPLPNHLHVPGLSRPLKPASTFSAKSPSALPPPKPKRFLTSGLVPGSKSAKPS
jgi:hypothetical protein